MNKEEEYERYLDEIEKKLKEEPVEVDEFGRPIRKLPVLSMLFDRYIKDEIKKVDELNLDEFGRPISEIDRFRLNQAISKAEERLSLLKKSNKKY